LKKWGEGASLIRKEWKTREENDGGKSVVDTKSYRSGGDEMAVDDEEDDEEDEDDEEEEEESDLEATPRMSPRRTIGVHSPQLKDDGSSNGMKNLTESLNTLSIVPNSVRFGRGGKSGGFISRGQGRRGRGRT